MFVDQWTIGQRLYAGCGVFLALTAIAGSVAIGGSARIKGDVATVTKRATELQSALAVQAALYKIESLEKTMLWAALDNDRSLYDASKGATLERYEEARQIVDTLAGMVDSDGDRTIARNLSDTLAEGRALHAQVATLSDEARFGEAQQMINERLSPVLQRADGAATAMVRSHQSAMAEAGRKSAVSYQTAQLLVVLVVAIAALLSVIGVWIVRRINGSLRGVSQELREGAQLVVDASSQMSISAQSMSQGAAQQAASLEETSASMEEMAGMTRRNADNSHQAAVVMADAAKVVENANAVLADMVSSMNSIKDSSNRVSKIIKTIDEIAFQTNILALNAAVEAARAGEAGMGFAVVADEVRSLAQRSAQAAKDTAVLIEEAITSSNEGSGKVEQVADAFAAITSNVVAIKSLVDDVSAASKQQALGIEQVTQAICQMERVTQTSAATAEESAAACEQLNAQADITMSVVQRLEVMVGRFREERDGGFPGAPSRKRGTGSRPVLAPSSGNGSPALAEHGSFGSF